MRYRLLGNSGLRVSEAALGTMTFGDERGWGGAKDEARKVYDAFRDAAGKHRKNNAGRSSEPGRLSTDMMKEFMPEQQRTDRVVAAVKTVSDASGRSMAQIALAWLRYRPVPSSPSSARVSFLSSRTTLRDQLKTLDEASKIELGFPMRCMRRRCPVQSRTAECGTRSWLV